MRRRDKEVRCPACGSTREAASVVGKTSSIKRGVKTVFEVLRCRCGKIYRGEVLEKRELPKRVTG
ncbi:hypothetical protein [Candidatus Pyrohabitans sp.]